MTCALAEAAQIDSNRIATDLFKLAIGHHGLQLPIIDVNTYLHGLTAYLAVLDIGLRAGRSVDDNAYGFTAKRAMQFSFV